VDSQTSEEIAIQEKGLPTKAGTPSPQIVLRREPLNSLRYARWKVLRKEHVLRAKWIWPLPICLMRDPIIVQDFVQGASQN